MTTISSYDVVGTKEDVSDIISNIAPTSTPFQSMIGSDKCGQRLFDWQEDSLMNVGENAQTEGATAPDAQSKPTVMRENTTQIFTKTASVTGSMQKTQTYGRRDEMAYQLGLRSKELKRDREWAFIGTGQGKEAGAAGTARKMAGYQAMIDPSMIYTAGAGMNASETPAASPLTEQMVLTTQQACYDNGADPTTIIVRPSDAATIADFSASNRTVMVQNQDTTLNHNISIYKSPFGTLKVVMDRFVRGTNASGSKDTTADALLFDPAMWKLVTFRDWFTQDLAITGDTKNKQILGEFSLKHMNFKGSA
ncbi:SU10 major capsid protein [Asaia prunellae]|uniref:SU10 major capsid protein n=1 Tax=Asaia prunellae TaxID=610245 RepID=UPI000470FC64|nr:DUF5309 family protein [Asaia prunellae]